MEDNNLISLAADIVSAHVSNNSVAISDVPQFLQRVHEALTTLASAETEKKVPVVSARASVKPDSLTCMECGKKQKMLKRHLMTAHGLTPQQYRRDYDLPDSYPMTAPAYAETRSALAKTIGLGGQGGAARQKPARRSRKKAAERS